MMRHWIAKFRNAFRGVTFGIEGQSSFCVHLPVASLVVLLAWYLECSLWQWVTLLLCIAFVLVLELMNSAMESLAKGLCDKENQQVGRALDIASGAVLIASLAAALIGSLIFLQQWWEAS